jgi:hypothetical protein
MTPDETGKSIQLTGATDLQLLDVLMDAGCGGFEAIVASYWVTRGKGPSVCVALGGGLSVARETVNRRRVYTIRGSNRDA